MTIFKTGDVIITDDVICNNTIRIYTSSNMKFPCDYIISNERMMIITDIAYAGATQVSLHIAYTRDNGLLGAGWVYAAAVKKVEETQD